MSSQQSTLLLIILINNIYDYLFIIFLCLLSQNWRIPHFPVNELNTGGLMISQNSVVKLTFIWNLHEFLARLFKINFFSRDMLSTKLSFDWISRYNILSGSLISSGWYFSDFLSHQHRMCLGTFLFTIFAKQKLRSLRLYRIFFMLR